MCTSSRPEHAPACPERAQRTHIRCSTNIVILITLFFYILPDLLLDLLFDLFTGLFAGVVKAGHLDVVGFTGVFVGPLDVFADLLKFQIDVLLLDDHLDSKEITIENVRLFKE